VKAQTQIVNEGITGVRYLKALFAIPDWVHDFDQAARDAQLAMRRSMYWASLPARALEYMVLVALPRDRPARDRARRQSHVRSADARRLFPGHYARAADTVLAGQRAHADHAGASQSAHVCELRTNVPVESAADVGAPVPPDLARRSLRFET
jgi:hypothetical protein